MMLSGSNEVEIILGLFIVLLGVLAVVRRCWPCDPELLRKAMHVGMGLVAFLLPWLFVSAWPVVVLAGLMMALLMSIRLTRPLRQKLGGVIHDVRRDSWGEMYFSLGVVGLFMISHDEPLHYGISILTLVLADTTASLIGCRHGFLRYRVLGECKSLEGSLAFLTTAFLIGALGLSFFGSVGIVVSLVVALGFAFPTTLVEALAGKGTDNVFVPLGTFALLKVLLALSPLALGTFLAVVVFVVPVFFLLLYKRSHRGSANGVVGSLQEDPSLRRLNFSAGLPGRGFFRAYEPGATRWHLVGPNSSTLND